MQPCTRLYSCTCHWWQHSRNKERNSQNFVFPGGMPGQWNKRAVLKMARMLNNASEGFGCHVNTNVSHRSLFCLVLPHLAHLQVLLKILVQFSSIGSLYFHHLCSSSFVSSCQNYRFISMNTVMLLSRVLLD